MNATQLLTKIATDHLGIETLETRNSDRLDFHDLSVWKIEMALRAAYEAGRDAGPPKAKMPKTKRLPKP